jgi:hypothetical protein
MEALHRVWRRPVCVMTAVESKSHLLRWDGSEHTDRLL